MEQSKEVGLCALNLPAKPSEVTADRRIHVALNSETLVCPDVLLQSSGMNTEHE